MTEINFKIEGQSIFRIVLELPLQLEQIQGEG